MFDDPVVEQLLEVRVSRGSALTGQSNGQRTDRSDLQGKGARPAQLAGEGDQLATIAFQV